MLPKKVALVEIFRHKIQGEKKCWGLIPDSSIPNTDYPIGIVGFAFKSEDGSIFAAMQAPNGLNSAQQESWKIACNCAIALLTQGTVLKNWEENLYIW